MKQNVDSVLKTDWFYFPIVFGMVVLLQNIICPKFSCCEEFALLSSSADINYL